MAISQGIVDLFNFWFFLKQLFAMVCIWYYVSFYHTDIRIGNEFEWDAISCGLCSHFLLVTEHYAVLVATLRYTDLNFYEYLNVQQIDLLSVTGWW